MISIVVPVYGCKDCLIALVDQVAKVMKSIEKTYEIVLVDDRSPDDSWSTVIELKQKNRQVVGIRLSRNFGQHAAITAGLAAAQGDQVVVMDCDLQDPPSLIPQFIDQINQGDCEIVFGRRIGKKQSFIRRWINLCYFTLIRALSGSKRDSRFGTFSMLSRKAVDAYLSLNDQNRHFLSITDWIGFDSSVVDFEWHERHSGRSSYNLIRLIRHAMQGIFFESTRLLTWILGLGFTVSLVGFSLVFYLVFNYFSNDSIPPGWTSLMVVMLVLFGFLFACVGVVGIYVSKVFDQTKNRPIYIVDKKL